MVIHTIVLLSAIGIWVAGTVSGVETKKPTQSSQVDGPSAQAGYQIAALKAHY